MSLQQSGEARRMTSKAERPDHDRLLVELLQAQARIRELEASLAAQQDVLNGVYASTSWRITRPLRGVKTVGNAAAHPRTTIKKMLARGAALLLNNPGARSTINALLNRFPRLREKLRHIVLPAISGSNQPLEDDFARTMSEERLPPSAHKVYVELMLQLSQQTPQ